MMVYKKFAEFYFKGAYRDYSQHILASFSSIQERYHLPKSGALLDLACGTGDFALGMAALGWQVTGLDQSEHMLAFAQQSTQEMGVSTAWVHCDMRNFDLPDQFDLVTCWYDSLNYMLTIEDLDQVFKHTYRALKPGGFFVFDMNTIYNLAVGWQQKPFYIQQDTKDLLEIHRISFEEENQIASLKVTGFIKQEDHWIRMDETHQERGYPIKDIITSLENVGFSIIDAITNLQVFSNPQPMSKRIWFIAAR